MGAVNANVVISNPANRDRSREGVFLVDTGATDSLVPRQHLEAIGLKPEAQRTYLLADGTEVEMDIASEAAGGRRQSRQQTTHLPHLINFLRVVQRKILLFMTCSTHYFS